MYTEAKKEKIEITEKVYEAIRTLRDFCNKSLNCDGCPFYTGECCGVEDLPDLEVITKKFYQLKED